MDLKRALQEASRAAREAGRILLGEFHRPGGPRAEGDRAAGDIEAEKLIRQRLVASSPGWGFSGSRTERLVGQPGAPVWLVDSNDGMRDYLEGRRGSSVAIALLLDRRPILGVVFVFGYPDDEGDLFSWAEECGSLRRNGRAIEARLPEHLTPLDVVLVSIRADLDPDGYFERIAPARYRTVCSFAHRTALVAAGEAAAAVSLSGLSAGGHAAGHALLRAVGGTLLDESGTEVEYAEDGSSRARFAFAGHAAIAAELAHRSWEPVRTSGPLPEHETERPRMGQKVSDIGVLSRAQGCLLGQVAGDSLGSLVEFRSSREIAVAFPDGPRRLEDGGVWHTVAGQPTDDSEMAWTLARCLVRNGGYSQDAALVAYREWYRSAPFDIGHTTRAALHGYLIGNSQANGSLMRASPLGVFAHASAPDAAAQWAQADSTLTHPHSACISAVAAFVVAVAHAVAHGDGPEAVFKAALAWAQSNASSSAVTESLLGAKDSPPMGDRDNQGWVLIAFRNAFYELLHAQNLEQGVVDTVRRGGDTDTNAAVTGALLGAVYGRNAVPEQWRRMILSCRAHSRRAKHARPPAYWPVDALELAEQLLLVGQSLPSTG